MARVTLRAVAKKAGVSYQTVSNVINNMDIVRPETRDRVKAVIEQMGYVPNYAARALRQARSMTVACVFYQVHASEVQDPYRTFVQAALAHAARNNNYSLLTYHVTDEPDSLRDIMQHFAQGRLDGAVLVGPSLPEQAQLQLKRSGQPLVIFDHSHPHKRWLSVTAEYREGILAVLQHLSQKGKRRIAFLAGHTSDSGNSGEERLQAYLDGMDELGVGTPAGYIQQGNWSFEGGKAAFRQFWLLNSRPEAIIAANDRMAAGLLNAALHAGVRVPQDLAITGVDDFEFTQYLVPSLTTVSVPYQQMADTAIKLLLEQMEGQTRSGVVRLPVTLKTRESS
ncbi:LacI family DNA-binding transcriptional regulator [Deinococcus roseus]|uniref:Alanine racemase n=1 Tax=Deinococcus roseus TaxID=392414 RepID=A0ABQ2D175_9DEIO|nr:LacI family DNA-binding transcriptional regulator [Deinococcus roseus]GGJ40873.1 alanine racemase [Deinococcus roseus]